MWFPAHPPLPDSDLPLTPTLTLTLTPPRRPRP